MFVFRTPSDKNVLDRIDMLIERFVFEQQDKVNHWPWPTQPFALETLIEVGKDALELYLDG